MSHVYLPPRAITASMQEFKRRAEARSVLSFGIDCIDQRMIPLLPGDVIGILGRPSMGKTYDMMYLARHHATMLRKQHGNKAPLVMYATWETLVEEFVGVFGSPYTGVSLEQIGRGNADLMQIQDGLVKLLGTNFAVFGRSMTDDDATQNPSLLNLAQSIKLLREEGRQVAVLYVDYLQRIPDFKGAMTMDNPTARVSENFEFIKNHVALGLKLPVVCGVQAKREVDNYGGVKLPQLDDAQHTSVIEQTVDKLFSITLPSKYMKLGIEFTVDGWRYTVQATTKVMRMLKQRFGPCDSSDTWVLEFDPINITLKPQPTLGEDTDPEDDAF